MNHFRNLGISYLHACGMLVGLLLGVLVVGSMIEGEWSTRDILSFWVCYSILFAVVYILPAYLIIGIPYYFGLIIRRPSIRPSLHYAAISCIVFTLTALAYAVIWTIYGGAWMWQWMIVALIASIIAISGTRTLIKCSSNSITPQNS